MAAENMIPEARAYSGREVLITGGLGFLGLNLTASLLAGGAHVRLLDIAGRLPPEYVGTILVQASIVPGGLADRPAVEKAIDGVTVIFNLAGRSGATASNQAPLDDLDVNARGHLAFLEVCRVVNPSVKIVFPSSRLVYEPTSNLPVPETAELGPRSIYGVHKILGEHYHRLYATMCGLRTTILRLTNPYGPFQRHGQNQYGIINWFIDRALRGQPLTVYGTGEQLRDYVCVDDVIRAFLMAGADARADQKVFNVGGGEAMSLFQTANLIVGTVGQGRVEHVAWPSDAVKTETGSFVADIGLIERTIGWTPRIRLEQGLRDVIGRWRLEDDDWPSRQIGTV